MNVRHITATLFHIAACAMYFAPIGRELPYEPFFLGRWPALTYWNLWLQTLYFGFAFILDVSKPSCFKYDSFLRARDKMYASVLFPVGTFVFSMFWTLFFIDRELVFPKAAEAHAPAWSNHISHTVVFPVLLVEMWLVKHHYPRRTVGLMITLFFGLSYLIWILFLFAILEEWPYGIIEILNPGYRTLLFVGCMAIFALFYLLGEKLSKCFWPQVESQVEFAKSAFGKSEASPILTMHVTEAGGDSRSEDPEEVVVAAGQEGGASRSLLEKSRDQEPTTSAAC